MNELHRIQTQNIKITPVIEQIYFIPIELLHLEV